MAMTYLDILEKIQAQTLENLKQIQAVQVSTLTTARELVASLPAKANSPGTATVESLPTLDQITELNAAFATQLNDQQKAFASQLAEVFKLTTTSSSN